MEESKFSKYEEARILGARALQISMNAPLLVNINEEDLEKINYDSLKIAEVELKSGILPISIKRPMPVRKEEELKRVKEVKMGDKKVMEKEIKEEEEISKEGEIMELVNPEDEREESPKNGTSEE